MSKKIAEKVIKKMGSDELNASLEKIVEAVNKMDELEERVSKLEEVVYNEKGE